MKRKENNKTVGLLYIAICQIIKLFQKKELLLTERKHKLLCAN